MQALLHAVRSWRLKGIRVWRIYCMSYTAHVTRSVDRMACFAAVRLAADHRRTTDSREAQLGRIRLPSRKWNKEEFGGCQKCNPSYSRNILGMMASGGGEPISATEEHSSGRTWDLIGPFDVRMSEMGHDMVSIANLTVYVYVYGLKVRADTSSSDK